MGVAGACLGKGNKNEKAGEQENHQILSESPSTSFAHHSLCLKHKFHAYKECRIRRKKKMANEADLEEL